MLHTNLSPLHEVCDSPDQAAHYHVLGPKLGASSLTWHLAGTEERSYHYFSIIWMLDMGPVSCRIFTETVSPHPVLSTLHMCSEWKVKIQRNIYGLIRSRNHWLAHHLVELRGSLRVWRSGLADSLLRSVGLIATVPAPVWRDTRPLSMDHRRRNWLNNRAVSAPKTHKRSNGKYLVLFLEYSNTGTWLPKRRDRVVNIPCSYSAGSWF
jgi:hypothetical protein